MRNLNDLGKIFQDAQSVTKLPGFSQGKSEVKQLYIVVVGV